MTKALKFPGAGLVIVLVVYVVCFGLLFLSGYRLSALAAAKAHFTVGPNAKLLQEVDFGGDIVYLLDTAEGPRTVLCTRRFFLWRAPAAASLKACSSPVKTVGWVSYEKGTLLAVEVTDPRVAFIEAGYSGPFSKRVRKEARIGELIVFKWEGEGYFLYELKPVALSSSGEILYEYRYAVEGHRIMANTAQWYPVTNR
ncbi:MAG: hypothetical protein QME76_08875 [Bacillota bacterium]|nr:hypothetical protein [Bacillota bacterium]